jgi:EmrB/QacA subfamily drug resistance transporter
MTTAVAPPGIDYSRKWYVMIAIAMGIFLGTIDGSIVNAALPTLAGELNTTFSAIQWVVLGYLLTMATLTLSIGRLGDMTGKRPIYTLGFALFTIASTLCGLAPTIGYLIGFRILQGVGASMIFALGFAIITEAFPPSERGRALGLTGAIVSVGIAIGPAAGGLIIDALSWHWIFLVNLPIGIIGTWTAWKFVPKVAPPGGQRFDFAGAIAFFVMLLSLMLALTFAQDHGFRSLLVVSLSTTFVVGLVAFLIIERHVEQPMLDFEIFRDPLLSVNLITGFLIFVAIAGMLILLPFYLQDILGYDVRAMGWLLAIIPIGLGMAAPISGSWSDRIGPRPVLVVGLVVTLGAFIGLTTLAADTSAVHYAMLALPIGIGIGIFQSPNNSAIMGSVPHQRLGVTSGMLTITRITGQITGISVLGALWSGRVAARAGVGDPTSAPREAQMGGLTDTLAVIVVLVAISLVLATWNLGRERTRRRQPVVTREAV